MNPLELYALVNETNTIFSLLIKFIKISEKRFTLRSYVEDKFFSYR